MECKILPIPGLEMLFKTFLLDVVFVTSDTPYDLIALCYYRIALNPRYLERISVPPQFSVRLCFEVKLVKSFTRIGLSLSYVFPSEGEAL